VRDVDGAEGDAEEVDGEAGDGCGRGDVESGWQLGDASSVGCEAEGAVGNVSFYVGTGGRGKEGSCGRTDTTKAKAKATDEA